jgi:hypothetical protein
MKLREYLEYEIRLRKLCVCHFVKFLLILFIVLKQHAFCLTNLRFQLVACTCSVCDC